MHVMCVSLHTDAPNLEQEVRLVLVVRDLARLKELGDDIVSVLAAVVKLRHGSCSACHVDSQIDGCARCG